jgi:F-type H+-transporting ATPase subunit b
MIEKVLPGCVVLMAVVPAFASEREGAGSPFAGDIGAALWTLIIFVVVVVILGKFAWGPILGALQRREDFIREALAHAKQDREDAEARLQEYHDKLNAAQAEARAIVDEARRDAEVVKHRIEDEAKQEAGALIGRAKREIEIATDTAVKELYDLSGKLATDIASRVIRKELDAREHERLIADSIEELGDIDQN